MQHYRHLSDGTYIIAFTVGLVSSLLSMLGSSLIVWNIIRKRKYRSSMFHRIMLGLSTADFLCTSAVILQPFLLPTYTNLMFAMGNDQTCTGVGVLMMFMVASYLYSCELSFYFLSVVWHGAKLQRSSSFPIEPWLHTWPWLLTVSISIVGVRAQAFTPSPVLGACWLGCTYTESRDDCLPHESVYASIPFMGVAFSSFLTGMICTCMVNFTVRWKIRRNEQHAFHPSKEFSPDNHFSIPQQRNTKLDLIAEQSLCYTGAYANSFLVILFGFIVSYWDVNEDEVDRPLFVVTLLIVYSFYPLQGWINFLIYSRPALLKWRAACPDHGYFRLMGQVATGRTAPEARRSHRSPISSHAKLKPPILHQDDSAMEFPKTQPGADVEC